MNNWKIFWLAWNCFWVITLSGCSSNSAEKHETNPKDSTTSWQSPPEPPLFQPSDFQFPYRNLRHFEINADTIDKFRKTVPRLSETQVAQLYQESFSAGKCPDWKDRREACVQFGEMYPYSITPQYITHGKDTCTLVTVLHCSEKPERYKLNYLLFAASDTILGRLHERGKLMSWAFMPFAALSERGGNQYQLRSEMTDSGSVLSTVIIHHPDGPGPEDSDSCVYLREMVPFGLEMILEENNYRKGTLQTKDYNNYVGILSSGEGD